MADIRMVHVPYRNFGAYSAELLAGRVHMCFGTISDMLQLSANDALLRWRSPPPRAAPLLPEVPTVAETLPGFEATAYNYIAVPAGTPREVVLAVNAAFNRVLDDAEVSSVWSPPGSKPSAPTRRNRPWQTILRERRRWKQVIEAAGIELEG